MSFPWCMSGEFHLNLIRFVLDFIHSFVTLEILHSQAFMHSPSLFYKWIWARISTAQNMYRKPRNVCTSLYHNYSKRIKANDRSAHIGGTTALAYRCVNCLIASFSIQNLMGKNPSSSTLHLISANWIMIRNSLPMTSSRRANHLIEATQM